MSDRPGDHEDRGIHGGGAATWDHGGAIGVGEATDTSHVEHRKCVLSCCDPWPGRSSFKCPSCRGVVWITEREDWPTRLELVSGAFGRWSRAFVDGFREAGAVLKVRASGR